MMPLPGEVSAHDVGLEVLAQIVRDAHRVEADAVGHYLLAELAELARDVQHLLQVAQLPRRRVRRRAHEELADEATLAHHVARVAW
jgi:hypothetical protein